MTSFSVNFYKGPVLCACDWAWPDTNRTMWTESVHDGNTWVEEGPLTEDGKDILLDKFGLTSQASGFPLGKLRTTSPAKLMESRRGLESQMDYPTMPGVANDHKPPLVVISDIIGSHVRAEEVA